MVWTASVQLLCSSLKTSSFKRSLLDVRECLKRAERGM